MKYDKMKHFEDVTLFACVFLLGIALAFLLDGMTDWVVGLS